MIAVLAVLAVPRTHPSGLRLVPYRLGQNINEPRLKRLLGPAGQHRHGRLQLVQAQDSVGAADIESAVEAALRLISKGWWKT